MTQSSYEASDFFDKYEHIAFLYEDLDSAEHTAEYIGNLEKRYLADETTYLRTLQRSARAFEPVGDKVYVDTTYPLATKVYWGMLAGTAVVEKILGESWSEVMHTRLTKNRQIIKDIGFGAASQNQYHSVQAEAIGKQAIHFSQDIELTHLNFGIEIANDLTQTSYDQDAVVQGFSYILGLAYRHFDDCNEVAESAELEYAVRSMFEPEFMKKLDDIWRRRSGRDYPPRS